MDNDLKTQDDPRTTYDADSESHTPLRLGVDFHVFSPCATSGAAPRRDFVHISSSSIVVNDAIIVVGNGGRKCRRSCYGSSPPDTRASTLWRAETKESIIAPLTRTGPGSLAFGDLFVASVCSERAACEQTDAAAVGDKAEELCNDACPGKTAFKSQEGSTAV
jgi:hypothetical protein